MIYIYCIKNIINNKRYIGQTSSLKRRISQHFRSKINRPLYSSIKKYGKENFRITLLATCFNQTYANEYEVLWIKIFNSIYPDGYNLEYGGRNNKNPSEETKIKMRNAKLGKPGMQKEAHPFWDIKGKDHYRFNTKHSKEAKEKISKAMFRRDPSVVKRGSKHHTAKFKEDDVKYMRYLFNNRTSTVREFTKAIAEKYNVYPKTIERVVYNKSWKHVK